MFSVSKTCWTTLYLCICSTDEYVRAIFDNFELSCTDVESCNKTKNLREAFDVYLEPAMVRTARGWFIGIVLRQTRDSGFNHP